MHEMGSVTHITLPVKWSLKSFSRNGSLNYLTVSLVKLNDINVS